MLVFATIPAQLATATIVESDTFTYPDGNLTSGSGGAWAAHSDSGSTPVQVASGRAVVNHGGTGLEDVNNVFASQTTGTVYYGIDFSVDDLGVDHSGADEYFAHFNSTGSFVARLHVTSPNVPATPAAQYTVAISTFETEEDVKWATDLDYGTNYRAVVGYDIALDQAQLWINPVSIASPSILGDDAVADVVSSIFSFSLRQSDPGPDEDVRVDNLIVATTFDEAAAIPEPGAFVFGGVVCVAIGLVAVGRRLLAR
jgi:hypothetical protein